jgi:hypothetical protein
MKCISIVVVAGLCTVAALPASAHHSGAMFDRSKVITLTGTIKQYDYTMPHTWVRLIVEQDGKQVEWDVEGGNPMRMKQVNLVPGVLNAGDKVTIRIHPLRDGRNGGSFIDVVLPNGETRKPL